MLYGKVFRFRRIPENIRSGGSEEELSRFDFFESRPLAKVLGGLFARERLDFVLGEYGFRAGDDVGD